GTGEDSMKWLILLIALLGIGVGAQATERQLITGRESIRAALAGHAGRQARIHIWNFGKRETLTGTVKEVHSDWFNLTGTHVTPEGRKTNSPFSMTIPFAGETAHVEAVELHP